MSSASCGAGSQFESPASWYFARASAELSSRISGNTVIRNPQRAPSLTQARTSSYRSPALMQISLAPSATRCSSQYSIKALPRMGRTARGTCSASAATGLRFTGQINSAFISACSFARQDRRHGLEQDFKIGGKAPGFNILHVELHLAGKINVAASADLPKTGDAGQDGQPAPVGERIKRHLPRQRRARTDQ